MVGFVSENRGAFNVATKIFAQLAVYKDIGPPGLA